MGYGLLFRIIYSGFFVCINNASNYIAMSTLTVKKGVSVSREKPFFAWEKNFYLAKNKFPNLVNKNAIKHYNRSMLYNSYFLRLTHICIVWMFFIYNYTWQLLRLDNITTWFIFYKKRLSFQSKK